MDDEYGINPFARLDDPETSQDAGSKVDSARLAAVVISHLKEKPMTTGEIAEESGEYINSISPRMAKLEQDGIIHKTEDVRKTDIYHRCSCCGNSDKIRKTRNQIVWKMSKTSDIYGA